MFLTATSAFAGEPIQSLLLDDHVIYTVPIGTNRVTTISFPGAISAIDAAGVTVDPKIPGQFQLAHAKGTAFLSVRALAPKATSNINVRFNKKTYVFELVESDQPVLSVILDSKVSGNTVEPAPSVSPTRLLALLDKAKAFPLLKKQQPESVAQVEFKSFSDSPQITDCGGYEIRIEEVYRFNPEDTLVFRLMLRNKTGEVIVYRTDRFALRVGNRLYSQSISDASGTIPPNGDAIAYFAITGTPDGGRNELSLKNQFSVIVERLPIPLIQANTNSPACSQILNPQANQPTNSPKAQP